MTATLDSLFALIEERGWRPSLADHTRPGLGYAHWSCILVNGDLVVAHVFAESALAAVTQAIRQAERATGGR